MKAAYLIRCSTRQQDYERQILDLNRLAERFELEKPTDKLIFGEYITGKDDTTKGDRKSIKNLLKAAEEHSFDVLLINEVSRLSRDSVSGRTYIRKLNNLGIPTYFRDKGKWTINPHTKDIDNAFERELGTYFDGAADYLKSLKTQTASGRRLKLMDNQMTQTIAFGYKRLGGNDKYTKNTIIVDEEKAPIVTYIYKKYLEEGGTLKSTALATSAKFGIKFSVGKVNHALNYKGYHLGYTTVTTKDPDTKQEQEFKITFEKLVSLEDYNAAQKKLKANRTSAKIRNSKQKTHLLSKLIKCSFCGHSFTPRKRTDGRNSYSWTCMSRINNSDAECQSTININDDKINTVIWELIKKELINFGLYNEQEKQSKISYEESNIKEYINDISELEKQIQLLDKSDNNAFIAFQDAPSVIKDRVKQDYYKTLEENQKKREYINDQISILKLKKEYSENKIDRYNRVDFAKDYIEEVENNENKMREIFLSYIKVIYPYKVAYRVLVLEVYTTDDERIFVLLDGNQRTKQTAYYIRSCFAVWQNSNNRYEAFEKGDYFVVTNASSVMDTSEIIELLSYEEMTKICENNMWTLDYSNYPNNINKDFVSNIEKYNKRRNEI